MQLKLLAALLGTFGFVSAAHAQIAGPPGETAPMRDLSGTYTSTWGPLVLHQNGNQVVGSYEFRDGQINGTFDGTALHFTWREADGAAGFGMFVAGPDGQLSGAWGVNDDHTGGVWQATPGSAAATSDINASLFGDSTLHTGSFSRELYMPWDDTIAAGNDWIGMAGLGAGVGTRVTPSWYVGVTGDWELMMQAGDSGELNRLRGGAEVRYTFGQSTASASVNCGPPSPTPLYYWLAARAGAETLDLGTTHGEYADLSLGADIALGQTQLGMYVSAGVSTEPTSAYGLPAAKGPNDAAASIAPQTDDPSSLGVYFTLGMRLARG